VKLTIGWGSRIVIAGVAALAAAIPSLPAGAADGSSSVTCSTGSSCEIQLENMVHFGGKNYSPGAHNMVVDITPPALACGSRSATRTQAASTY